MKGRAKHTHGNTGGGVGGGAVVEATIRSITVGLPAAEIMGAAVAAMAEARDDCRRCRLWDAIRSQQ